MTAEQLTWWQVSHGLSNSQAAIRLCMSRRHFIRLRRGLSPIPGYLGLVCAAIAAGVPPWTSEPPKNDPKAMPGGMIFLSGSCVRVGAREGLRNGKTRTA